MSGYTDTLARLAASSEQTVVALHDRLEAGEITEQEFVELGTAALVRAGARGVGLADLAVAAFLSADEGTARPTLGLALPDDDPSTTRTAVLAALGSAAYLTDPRAAVGVLGRAEPLDRAQQAYGQAMRGQGVQAWTRVLSGNACSLCQALAGPVLPASADMYHHKGCSCSQRPITERNPR